MILLNDILNFSEKELKNTKIRFNKSNNNDYDPARLFKDKDDRLYNGQFWNYSKTKSFQTGQIAIGFIKIDSDKWLLFDISLITKDLGKYDGVGYEYQTVEKYQKYFGRLIVKYKNKSQNMIRRAESVINECEVFEISNDTFDVDVFPGYENIDLSWHELKSVVVRKDWKTALENQKGIYLITDVESGKRYVGSAYGESMLLGRWRNYIENGNGGNKDLKQLDFEYIKSNFRYSILEIYKSTTDDKVIMKREQHWMKVLLTKDNRYGYNN
ncbi:GIY-YIG catalytic domain-containing protein [Tindallia magadiensis]|uniref:GIY-YIG catalytic domain-containing protein n=1 Tax=Tindallia magadiensis TaxID=69895 RepID=A0A1I3I2T1_9FIRM|nr:GIY-YIG nuclease family protein [Tindallia magadiensis]SFI42147.1 GIY-YIG catalytic domain-containing protein [Tindallia magadiensis]